MDLKILLLLLVIGVAWEVRAAENRLTDKDYEIGFTASDPALKCSACQLSARLFRRAIDQLVDEQREEAKRFLSTITSMDDIPTSDPQYGFYQSIKHYAPSEQMDLLWRRDFQRLGPTAFLTLEEICTHEQEHVGILVLGSKLLPVVRHLEGANEGDHGNSDYFQRQEGEHRHETFLQHEKGQRQEGDGSSATDRKIVQRRWASSAFARECYDLYRRTESDLMEYTLSKKDVSWCSAVCVDKKKRLGDDDL